MQMLSRMGSLVLVWSLLLIFLTQCQGLRPPHLVRFRKAKMPADLNALSAQRKEEVAGLGAGVRAQPFITCEGLRTGRSVGVVGICVLTGEIVASVDIGLQDTSGIMAGSFVEAMPSGIGRVKNVLVTKKNRGTGLGRDVMEEAEKLAVEKRLCGLELEVDTANEVALNLCKCALGASIFYVFTSCLCYLCKYLALNPLLRCPLQFCRSQLGLQNERHRDPRRSDRPIRRMAFADTNVQGPAVTAVRATAPRHWRSPRRQTNCSLDSTFGTILEPLKLKQIDFDFHATYIQPKFMHI